MTSISINAESEDIQNVLISTELPDQKLPTRPYSKYNVTVESIASMGANIMMEEKENDKRKLSLIMHNIPESSLTEAYARKKEDIQNFTTLFNQ